MTWSRLPMCLQCDPQAADGLRPGWRGLGYIKLGQQAHPLRGELSGSSWARSCKGPGNDALPESNREEPTTGLRFYDVQQRWTVMQRWSHNGQNSIVVDRPNSMYIAALLADRPRPRGQRVGDRGGRHARAVCRERSSHHRPLPQRGALAIPPVAGDV